MLLKVIYFINKNKINHYQREGLIHFKQKPEIMIDYDKYHWICLMDSSVITGIRIYSVWLSNSYHKNSMAFGPPDAEIDLINLSQNDQKKVLDEVNAYLAKNPTKKVFFENGVYYWP